jgi:putative iron-regulated protein
MWRPSFLLKLWALSTLWTCMEPTMEPMLLSTTSPGLGSIVRSYSENAHRLYRECGSSVEVLAAAVATLGKEPTEANLTRAREAWVRGRAIYGRTEVFRFYDGPIDNPVDGVETLVNAWPIDESYIDAVPGFPKSGIIHDSVRYPILSEVVLTLANERGGEANVSLGWHAIEFLLWGQDLRTDGPGERPATDFDSSKESSAPRRLEYLKTAVAALRKHLAIVELAWAPGKSNYRREFEADTKLALRRILTGAIILTGFEMAGERLAVAYETRDQEQEHSCFSDTTWLDFQSNQRGVVDILRGTDPESNGVLAYLARTHPEAAWDLDRKLGWATEALERIPRPFDQAFLGEDKAPGRVALAAALSALEAQAEAIAVAGVLLGHRLPMRPGG